MINISMEIPPSVYEKISVDNIKKLEKDIIQYSTLGLQEEAQIECPVDTGRMQSSISSLIQHDEGIVAAHVDYAQYVINGTSRQAPNDFPLRAKNTFMSKDIIKNLIK